jgi:hypothetical protein
MDKKSFMILVSLLLILLSCFNIRLTLIIVLARLRM